MYKIKTPLSKEEIEKLDVGMSVRISGIVYTARDAAHKRFVELIRKGKNLPVNLKNQIIFYASPTPEKPGKTIGSIGPTTSKRMDVHTGILLKNGLKGMIGKGPRTEEIRKEIKKHGAIYFIATGGAGAYLSKHVEEKEVAAFKDLGVEAVLKLKIKDFPVLVAIDSKGNSIFPYGVS
ncbi:MAG: fumarate hydratase C-terminal domain-containing protein [Actinomycetia bacterium]|nr:fumarate hydratase C-terminal domain-containing protein [Actinomycetes bacterium]